MPGPVPKRSDQRRRRNKPEGLPTVKAAGAGSVKPLAEDRDWHISAKRWYRSLKTLWAVGVFRTVRLGGRAHLRDDPV